MNKHIRSFVYYEDPNIPHKKVVKSLICLPFLLLPIINMFSYFIIQDVNEMFYSLVPFAIIGAIWGIILLHNIESKRKQYYLFCGIMKLYWSIIISHFTLMIIVAFIELYPLFYFFYYLIFIIYIIIKIILTKKQIIKNGFKTKSYASLSFGACLGIGLLARIFLKSLQATVGNNITILIGLICGFYVAISFINLGINDLLKYYYIKKLEIDEFYESVENYKLDNLF